MSKKAADAQKLAETIARIEARFDRYFASLANPPRRK